MKKVKKYIAVLLVAALIMTVTPISVVVSAATTGTTGSCTWTLNGTELTISGKGEMNNYYAPWGTAITKVTIGNGVTSIGDGAFADCRGLTSVTIGHGVTSIGDYAFKDCRGLKSITIPDSVTSIGDEAFYGCSGLTSITIPDSVTSIGYGAFEDCSGLTSITIPDSVTSIGDYAFSGCSSLTSVTIPDSVTSIGGGAFYGTAYYDNEENWTNDVLFIGNHLIEANYDLIGSYTIPAGTKTIAGGAFSNHSELSSVTIPQSVTSIGDSAFSGCSHLTSVTIPQSVTSIGDSAFSGCSSLTEISVESGNPVYSSADGVLFNKDKMELLICPGGKNGNYVIPDGVISIGEDAFRNCSSLTTVTIPQSVTSIGRWAFFYCSSLTSVTIPQSVTSIGWGAFHDCSSLTSVTIPDSVTSIGGGAFYGTAYYDNEENWTNDVLFIGNHLIEANYDLIGSYTIPTGTKTIAGGAFSNRSELTSVTIPQSVTSIGDSAFSGCSSLTEISVESGNPVYSSADGVLFNKDKTELLICPRGKNGNYVIPQSVTSIGTWAFGGCSGLSSVIIPKSVTSIGDWAFYDCSKLTIKCYKNSVAHQYAVSEKIPYILIDNSSSIDVSKAFTDVPKKAWYTGAVSFAVNNKLFDGVGGGKFDPNGNMTRAMYVTVLGRLAGVNVSKNVFTKFVDVPSGKWYTGYVKWASDSGIVNGTDAKHFEPEADVTREQICKMMVEYCKYAGVTLKNSKPAVTFKDAKKISSWAKKYVSTCQRAGLVNGDNGYFKPQGNATRAEVATIFMNFDNNYHVIP